VASHSRKSSLPSPFRSPARILGPGPAALMSKVFIKTASAVAWADAKRGIAIANMKINEKQPIRDF